MNKNTAYQNIPIGKPIFNTKSLPPLRKGDILLHGHTHIAACEEHENYVYCNPGSVSIPKGNSEHGYMTLENGCFYWKKLDGEVYDTYRLKSGFNHDKLHQR